MAKHSTIEVQQEQATRVLAQMNQQLVSINQVLKKANATLNGIDKKDKEYAKLNATLQSINTTTKRAIELFNADKKKIASKLADANKFYTQKYLPLAKKINDPANGFSAKLKETQKDYTTYKTVKATCEAKFTEITDIAKESANKSNGIAKIESAIVKFHKAAENNTTKIDNLLIKAGETNTKINQIHKDLIALKQTSQDLKNNIATLENDSKTLKANIVDYHKTSEERLTEIEKVYKIAHETGLSGEFDQRRNALSNAIKKWGRYVLWTSVVLLGGIIALFIWQYRANGCKFENLFNWSFYVRFLIFSPIVYYLYFVSTQYNKAEKLHDKYAFKTTLSMTIKYHIELLTQNGYFEQEGQCDKILDFILDGFRKIYSEPYGSDDYKMKIKLADFEIDLHKKIIDKLSKITGYDAANDTIKSVIEK